MQPQPEHDLHFAAPITRWDEALPLGNGLLGALCWGEGDPLILSLDRADLWDLRPVPEWESPDYNYKTMRRWIEERRVDDLRRLYEAPYDEAPGPTKIPAGRLTLYFGDGVRVEESRLHLGEARAEVRLSDGRCVEVFIHATDPFGVLRVTGAGELPEVEVVAPAYASAGADPGESLASRRALANLGYPPAERERLGPATGFRQAGWGGFTYSVAVAWRRTAPGVWEAVWSIATASDAGDDPWPLAAQRVSDALDRGYSALLATHRMWWERYWDQSGVRVPNERIERQWYLDTYKFGAAARQGAPPITLQAVWTADDGLIPPWKGDYHHDLNTQLSYWPCYSGNRLEEGLGFLDWLWETRDEALAFTRRFWDLPGLNVPMTADLAGRQMGGWHPYTHSATTSAWLAHHFYLHWQCSQDRKFLAERAYPYLADVCTFLEAVTELDDAGQRYLALSSSPEIHDNHLEAWLTPTSNYDLALIRFAFGAAAELAYELGLTDAARRWERCLSQCPDFSYAEDGRLLVAPGEPLRKSHRHHSHLMAIHPLGLVTAQRALQGALAEFDRLGTDGWTGYSFAWEASFAAWAGDGERAAKALDIFAKAFCSRNSFHVNGDQTDCGYSQYKSRPFTLEGNFAAAAGLQEMLLQSAGGVVKVFPAVPADWRDASFENLRARGAFLVSAKRADDSVTEVQVIAEMGGTLRLLDPFGGAGAHLTATGVAVEAVRREADVWVADLPQGASLVWKR